MQSYSVRPAVVRDAQTVAELHAEAAAAAYRGLVPDEQLNALPMAKRLAMWRDAIDFGEPQVHVATLGEQVIGFVGFDRSRDPKSKPTMGEVWSLYVAPAQWGRGVGLALWDAARDGLDEEGCTHASVWVPLANERALRFFEHAGFKRELNTAKTAVIGGVKLEEIRLKRGID